MREDLEDLIVDNPKKTANLCNSQASFFPLSEKRHKTLIYIRITSAGSQPADVCVRRIHLFRCTELPTLRGHLGSSTSLSMSHGLCAPQWHGKCLSSQYTYTIWRQQVGQSGRACVARSPVPFFLVLLGRGDRTH